MSRHFPFAMLAVLCAPAAFGQLQLYQVAGAIQTPVSAVFAFGSIDAGDSTAISFRLRNAGTAAVSLESPTISGPGFVLVAPAPPATLGSGGFFDFVVSFQPATAGSYSAVLQAGSASVLLTGTAAPVLTFQVVGAAGAQPLTGTVDFGSVLLGSSAVMRFVVLNQTPLGFTVPAISISGADFKLSGASPSGTILQPLDSVIFTVAFTPAAAGARTGTLAIGTLSWALAGTGQAPPLPKASMTVTLPQPQSAQQGTVNVALDSPVFAGASGTVTLSFTPAAGIPSAAAADPAIGFASGGLVAAFTVAAGASQVNFGTQSSAAFSTGTTAGSFVFTLAFGGVTTEQTFNVIPAAPALTAVSAARQSAAIVVQATGFDNIRTAGKLTFTFYDAAGNAIAPGAITTDSTAAFANYFSGSTPGGTFSLTAVFPVTGAPAQIAAFDFAIANSAGSTKSARVVF